MENFYVLKIPRFGDERGRLTTLEVGREVPFEIKRTYYLSDVAEDKNRACHAHKISKRVLSVICGSCDVSLYDGNNKKEIVLDNPERGIYFNSGVWCELSNFKKGTVVLALASEPYFEEEYIRNFEDYIKYIKDKKHYESNDDSRHTT